MLATGRARTRRAACERHHQRGDEAQRDEHHRRRPDEHHGDAAVIGERDRETRERGAGDRDAGDVAPARPARSRRHLVAEQGRDRHVVGAPERPQGERARGRQAIDDGERQFARMDRRRDRDRQHAAERRGDRERQPGAGDKPDGAAGEREHQHLGEVDGKHLAAGRAQRLERRDHVALAVEIVLDRVGDADPADEQRCQPDEGQIFGEAFDVAAEFGGRVGAGAHFPAGVGQFGARLGGDRLDRTVARVARKPHSIVPAHDAAGLEQAGCAQRVGADQEARSERNAAGELVGLGLEHGADFDAGLAHLQFSARRHVEAGEEIGTGDRAVNAVARGEETRQVAVRVGRDRAVERIGPVDGLDLDQRHAAVAGARHRPHGGGRRHPAGAIEKGAFGRTCLALDQGKGEVAAEDRAAFAGQSVLQAAGERADAGDRHHAQRQARHEHVEAAQPGAQLAHRKPQGQAEVAAARGGRHAGENGGHAGIRARAGSSMRPERRRTTRPQRCAKAASWVTRTRVVPRSRWPANMRSITCRPVASSRFPVGSSATRIAGSGASARASATRCCSPPDSSAG
jgi:hypothetical protein